MFEILMKTIGPALTHVLGSVIQNPVDALKAAQEIIARLQAKQDEIDRLMIEAVKAQSEVNKAEAQSPSLFVAGWRPFIGWVCGLGAAYAFIVQPGITVALWAWHGASGPPPVPDMSQLMAMLGGMLGFGGLRTYERVVGVDRSNMSTNTDAGGPAPKRTFKFPSLSRSS